MALHLVAWSLGVLWVVGLFMPWAEMTVAGHQVDVGVYGLGTVPHVVTWSIDMPAACSYNSGFYTMATVFYLVACVDWALNLYNGGVGLRQALIPSPGQVFCGKASPLFYGGATAVFIAANVSWSLCLSQLPTYFGVHYTVMQSLTLVGTLIQLGFAGYLLALAFWVFDYWCCRRVPLTDNRVPSDPSDP